ncbi:MAG: prepilin-type N-terminal cleavage/methylation domain-containing protein [Candidatus Omnitrophota bacterium]
MIKKKKRNFTLIELLVSIAIITLLAAMILSAISRTREKTQSIVCLNNLRQLGLAIQMYTQDNYENLPSEIGWIDEVSKYVYEKEEIYSCPSEKNKRGATDYGYNAKAANRKLSGSNHVGIFPLIFDRNPGADPVLAADPDPGSPNYYANFYYDFCSNRHYGGTNFLFLDGHATWIKAPMSAEINILNFNPE